LIALLFVPRGDVFKTTEMVHINLSLHKHISVSHPVIFHVLKAIPQYSFMFFNSVITKPFI